LRPTRGANALKPFGFSCWHEPRSELSTAGIPPCKETAMKDRLKRLLCATAVAAIAAPFGTLHALDLTKASAEQQEAPKDCKAKPDDPRCKDERKY
jgi:hypothetical protein